MNSRGHITMFRHEKILIILSYLLVLSLTSLAQSSDVNKTQLPAGSGSGQVANVPFATAVASNTDEDNGDDGPQLKKDIKDVDMTNKTTDNHQFYQPEYIDQPERAMSYWLDFETQVPKDQNISTKHEMLSKSHRRASPIKLSFDFPFYGQPLRNIIIATGGFLYVGEHLHHWLAATQNISPLMANFDLSTSNSSDIHYYDNGSSLVVQWQNVLMKDNKPPGNFSFQVTLQKNGDIIFVYKSLPAPITEIPEDEHPVKVGISDAFLIDKVVFFIRRKTIYDYHRINLKESPVIKNRTAIYLKALPTCNQYDTCELCSKADQKLDCIWCPAIKRCSNGYDRKRQEWLANQCEKITKSDCSIRADATSSSTASQSQSSSSSSNQLISVPDSPISGRQIINNDRSIPDPRNSDGGTAFITLLMFLGLTSGIALWAFYAYRNPHTPSGQLLIKYRPSNWRWQNSETRYTAASIHM